MECHISFLQSRHNFNSFLLAGGVRRTRNSAVDLLTTVSYSVIRDGDIWLCLYEYQCLLG